MYSNHKSGCCCYNDLSHQNSYCNISPPTYYPSGCCCCPVYDQHNKRIKKLSKPLLTVPEMKPSIESFSNKSTAKIKKKTGKMKKIGEDSLQSRASKDEIAEGKLAQVHSSLSETLLRKATSNSNLYKSASLGKQKDQRWQSPGAGYGNLSRSMDMRHQQHHPYNTLDYGREASYDPTPLAGKSSRTLSKPDKDFFPNQHLMPSGTDPFKCYCFCCSKESPVYVGPVNLSKHSFASSKSSPQLDVICEEDMEAENRQKLGEGPTEQMSSSSFTKSKKHKKLEDSCTEFLTIICDNILESVQKSVDGKLKEFSKEAADKIDILGEKMAKNESAIQNLCSLVLEKITEQNKSNFEAFYSRVQNLVQNQSPMNMRTTAHEELDYPQAAEDGPMTRGRETPGFPPRAATSTAHISEEAKQQQQPSMLAASKAIASSQHSDREHPGLQARIIKSTTHIAAEVIQQQKLGWDVPTMIASSYQNDIETGKLYPTAPAGAEVLQKQQSARNIATTTGSLHPNETKTPGVRKRTIDSVTATEKSTSAEKSTTSETHKLKNFSTTKQNTTHEACDIDNNDPDAASGCCHWCTNCCEEVHYNHPCCPNGSISETATHPCDNVRETGGCIKRRSISSALHTQEINSQGRSLNSTPTGSSTNLSIPPMKSPCAAHTESSSSSSSSPTTVTTFSLTPPGKTIFNCTCFAHRLERDDSVAMKASDGTAAIDNSCDVKINCPARCESYDTSGYASEPEDNKDDIVSNTGGRKLLKSTSKISCISQTSHSSILKLPHATLAADMTKENAANQTIQKVTGSSSKNYNSLSRLFRL